ncbi:MAG: ABC transporter ATP-binding protein [Minisyncoccia bacterium]|jgi:peptide/nickel transport system ATP-binding protein
MENILVEIKNLSKIFISHKKKFKILALNDINMVIPDRTIVGLIGESGSGKSTLAKILVGLEKYDSGKININYKDSFNIFQIIFQDPFSSFNPTFTIKKSLLEPIYLNKKLFKNIDKEKLLVETLTEVNLLPPSYYLEKYPYELSGGELQRAAFARAIISKPKIIIADEPASMLDASIRVGILNLLKKLRDDLGISILFITHDIFQALYVTDYLYVIYLGEIMECGSTKEIIYNPYHPYTKGLIDSILTSDEDRIPVPMQGEIPSPFNLPEGCVFQSRCPFKKDVCINKKPELRKIDNRCVKCYLYP